ncbi:MAG: radical SAM protein [Candidatus Aminicenantes bacterium]|nr:radical SAM protein [Candidatus Aminicenantes bacterium]NIM78274.1 radical SAM protein [Candidatus Aminicenantes bacterium]NIN19699.1 radical SAM protein [Candidatus Aminicenantes bacterium]NIN43581.1 radical SAM protein [Candidatus Aminicenantes bacterium]NIN86326.1 radical SAM protein [Candidatus Aminicenantes bacterium]
MDRENSDTPKPFIKKLKTANYNYIYDVHSNELIRVTPLIYDIIDEIAENNADQVVEKYKSKYEPNDIRESFASIKKAHTEHNYFSFHRPEIFSGFSSEYDVKYMLDSGLSQLILELSTRCNQSCKYCSVSGRYSQNGKQDMPPHIAKKAVDFFVERIAVNRKETTPAVTFYGGEVLKRFDLLKEVVEWTKSKGVFQKYRFSLTTNGTLLTDEIIAYFVENNISILLSLDGPKKIHNRFRVFRNGKGTFDAIMKNLERIQQYSRDYFLNLISFNTVITPPYDFDAVIDFFFASEFLSPLKHKVRINFVDAYETSFFRDFQLEGEKKNLRKEFTKLRNRYKEALINGTHEELTVENSLFLQDFYAIVRRPLETLPRQYPPKGSCIPGQRRLFVNTQGKFYMCEKVGSNYEIGNVDGGIDYKRIYNFYREYDRFFSDCKDCWALRLCTKCFNNIRQGERFDEVRKKELCKSMLRNIEENFVIYCEIMESKPDAFKFFENVKIT